MKVSVIGVDACRVPRCHNRERRNKECINLMRVSFSDSVWGERVCRCVSVPWDMYCVWIERGHGL